MADTGLETIKLFSTDKYSNEERLKARIQLYRHTERKIDFHDWIFQQLDFQQVAHVADLGCGTGLLWTNNREAIPADIGIILSDISEGMVRYCRDALKDDTRFSFAVADAASTPFESRRYQMILANHMVNHFDDPGPLFGEFHRLLTDDGYIYSSTPSIESPFNALSDIADGFDRRLILEDDGILRNFSFENGEAVLAPYFDVVDVIPFQNDIVTSDADSLLLYLASCYEGEQLAFMVSTYDSFRNHIESIISRTGTIRLTNKAGLFKYRKKS